jgi:serine O-acetyltransferase
MLETVREDLRHKVARRGFPPTLASYVRACGSEGSLAQLLYRAMRFCGGHGLGLPALVIYRINALVGQAVIGRGADLGPGLVILHASGTVINTSVRAGKNLVLEHAVTLGEVRGRSPVLGDNVYVGAGAKVIGPVRVGSDVTIGANAVVTRDLPDGATAVGVPARVIKIYGQPVPGEVTGRKQKRA